MFNLDDPKVQALLMAAGGLLTPTRARGGAALAEGVSRGIQGGLLGYQQGVQMRDMSAQRDMQRRMQEAQLGEFQRGQDFNKALSSGYSPGVTPSTPVDDNGFPMPRSGPQMDFSKAMGIDPMKAMQAQAAWQQMNAKAGPQFKEVGGRLVRIDGDQVKEAYAPPAKPVFQPGQTREIKSGRTVITQEWDGSGWKQIAKSAMDKPETDTGPKAPPGYRWAGDRLEPIPGGPQDTKVGKEAEAQAKRQEGALARADFVLGKVGEAKQQAGGWNATGMIGGIARNVPGSGAYNLNRTLDAIKANIGFAELQAMREASPTGGALGQVAVQELNMLQSVLGSLDNAQDESQLIKSLESIEKHYTNWKRAVEQSSGGKSGASGGWEGNADPLGLRK